MTTFGGMWNGNEPQLASTFVENIYSNPDVVSDIYIWETSHGTDPRLLRLNADTARIERSALPAELRPLLAHLQRNASNLRVALRAWEADATPAKGDQTRELESSLAHKLRSTAITGWQFDESIPAIVHPIVHHGQRAFGARGPVDWFVIVLNRSTIEQRIFPESLNATSRGGKGWNISWRCCPLARRMAFSILQTRVLERRT